jgi:hypothetical protein
MSETPTEDFQALVDLVRSHQRVQALAVAARLGIADLLRDGPRDVGDLADVTGTHGPTLYRLLRALATIGVFTELEGHRFGLGERGEYMRTDHPLSVAPLARMYAGSYEWQAWGELLHSVRTGGNAARHALGMDVWEHRRRNPEDQDVFDAAMRTLSRAATPGILAAHDFVRHRVLADIGGGTGALLAAVLRAHPGLRGVLVDQAQVLAGADEVLRAAGVADRVDVVVGDFFAEVPAGADAYLLSRILPRLAGRRRRGDPPPGPRGAVAGLGPAPPRRGRGPTWLRCPGGLPRPHDAGQRRRPGAHRGGVVRAVPDDGASLGGGHAGRAQQPPDHRRPGVTPRSRAGGRRPG